MTKVLIFKSMSLDGFIADPNDEIDPLHDWLFTTKPGSREASSWNRADRKTERFFGPEGVNKEILMSGMAVEGATVIGRRTVGGWRGKPPGNGPYFVLTDKPPSKDDVSSVYTFVNDGIESAVHFVDLPNEAPSQGPVMVFMTENLPATVCELALKGVMIAMGRQRRL
jgi:dihydrofolate reductase